jgi:hypothetical protein
MNEVFQEDQVMEKIQYWGDQQDALGYETVWSMWEWADIDQNIFRDGAKRICYTFYAQDATVEELLNGTAQQIEVSAIAVNGSVRELWRAAESCYQQAKAQGDWHRFIEDIELRDDGSFELTMGS